MAIAKTDRGKKASRSRPLKVSSCKIDALVTIDGRGQSVLPNDLRKRTVIEPGDKLAVISWERGDEVCRITLMKAEYFAGSVRDMLGPIIKDILA